MRASLTPCADGLPNGLMGVILPSAGLPPLAPRRLRRRLASQGGADAYARWYWYPGREDELTEWIEDASLARVTRAHLLHAWPGQPVYRPQAATGRAPPSTRRRAPVNVAGSGN